MLRVIIILNLRILLLIYLLLSNFYTGCTVLTVPKYTVFIPGNESIIKTNEGASVTGGWEFQFSKAYYVEKLTIKYEGALLRVDVHQKTKAGWEYVKTSDVQESNPLTMELNINTDAIRLYPEFSKKGNIEFCQFYIGKGQKVFSIPLERPPFIK